MSRITASVAMKRKYKVERVKDARAIALEWLRRNKLNSFVSLGLPEIDDRYHIWRIPLKTLGGEERIGEIVVGAFTGEIDPGKSTKPTVIKTRSKKFSIKGQSNKEKKKYVISSQPNTIALGDSENILNKLEPESVNLVFTSPPYYNARPEYSDYVSYEEYLEKLRRVIAACARVLSEGRFFVINISPVLIRRASRSEASRRIAVPFDVHQLFVQEGFDFIDDIHWVKPDGAGWATGRGRRFAADRTPLQYKAVPITEYVLVYRKKTDKLIDWNIRSHPDKGAVIESKIDGDYDQTNLWKIHPAFDKNHPAIFPVELAERVVKYYSFKSDVVLDPFAGIGTVGEAATRLGRRFVLSEINEKYHQIICEKAKKWLWPNEDEILHLQ